MSVFDIDVVGQCLRAFETQSSTAITRYWVAYSGGLDSHVLLATLARLHKQGQPSTEQPIQLQAVHIHHGLSDHADHWVDHCQITCDSLEIPLTIIKVDATPLKNTSRKESPEEGARRARYQAFSQLIESGDCLLTAHHEDDQAETVLLQMMRGCGVKGLAAMPRLSAFHLGHHARPLLNVSREQLYAFAKSLSLQWIEDASNFDTRYTRNLIRHELMPLLKTHWPKVSRTIARTARHCASSADLLDEIANLDLEHVKSLIPRQLSITALQLLSRARQDNVIRHWLTTLCLPLPATTHLDHIHHDLLTDEGSESGLVNWQGAEVRRFRDELVALHPLPVIEPDMIIEWDISKQKEIETPSGGLRMIEVVGEGLSQSACMENNVTICFRQGGERFHQHGHEHSTTLKKLLNASEIPPWERGRLALVYIGDELSAISDHWVGKTHYANSGEAGFKLEWFNC